MTAQLMTWYTQNLNNTGEMLWQKDNDKKYLHSVLTWCENQVVFSTSVTGKSPPQQVEV